MKFDMILTENNRSKAYLQGLIDKNIFPEKVFYLQGKKSNENNIMNDNAIYESYEQEIFKQFELSSIKFNDREPIKKMLEEKKIQYFILESDDINSEIVIDTLKIYGNEYIVFSGRGGNLLKKEVLSIGKKFLHVHPGKLPEYKGSTAFYYSLLIEGTITCSLIVLNENIDDGNLIYEKSFKMKKGYFDYDNLVDPILRADTLVEYMEKTSEIEDTSGKLSEHYDKKENIFYIIHPVLKHIAIKKQIE